MLLLHQSAPQKTRFSTLDEGAESGSTRKRKYSLLLLPPPGCSHPKILNHTFSLTHPSTWLRKRTSFSAPGFATGLVSWLSDRSCMPWKAFTGRIHSFSLLESRPGESNRSPPVEPAKRYGPKRTALKLANCGRSSAHRGDQVAVRMTGD